MISAIGFLVLTGLVINLEAYNLPTIGEMSQMFGEMLLKLKSVGIGSTGETESREKTSKRTNRERLKRQTSNIGDESQLPHEIRASSLPLNGDGVTVNTRYMPTIGNGYIGATIYDDSLFLNGLFNGVGGQSHRAAIPAVLMGRISINNADIDRRASRKYILNALEGYFMETIDTEYGQVWHKIYIHQKYIRLFVVDTYAKLKPGAYGGLVLNVRYPSLNSSSDIAFTNPIAYQAGSWQVTGTTKSAEAGEKTQQVNMFYSEPLVQIGIVGTMKEINITQVMAVDRIQANARNEFDLAQTMLKTSSWQLFLEHSNAWKMTWNNGRVELQGSDNQLMKAVWFAQYYLLSSLPAEFPYLPPTFTEPFYGLSRTGLAKGKVGKDYQGHVMWDNEYYLLPPILPFHPALAKSMMRYRSATASKARANAALYGGVGYHYAVQSGISGADVSPDACPATDPKCHWNRYYVTAGINYAIRLYHSMTRDRDYMVNTVYSGCDVSREVARFLANQAIYSPEHGRYVMNDIIGPDEFHPNVNNNAFTLCASSLAIHWARYYSCMCQRNELDEIPDEYVQKAMFLDLPFDHVKRLHLQHDGFNPATDGPVKQADVVLLNYPLNWNYSVDIMKNDLELYELLTTDRTPAMTWSWFTIGWKWVGEKGKARSYFLKSYQDYIIQPFKIWTEYTERNPTDQAVGNVNFLPGMGAFLQSIIYGFAGFRIRPDKLEIFDPTPPPGSSQITLLNFQYLGTNMTFTITDRNTKLQVLKVNNLLPLILRRNMTGAVEESLTAGATVNIDKSVSNGFFIYPSIAETCEHPRDYIYIQGLYGFPNSGMMGVPLHYSHLASAITIAVALCCLTAVTLPQL